MARRRSPREHPPGWGAGAAGPGRPCTFVLCGLEQVTLGGLCAFHLQSGDGTTTSAIVWMWGFRENVGMWGPVLGNDQL